MQKCRVLKEIPARKLQLLNENKNKSLKDAIGVLKRSSEMTLINDISDNQYGVSEVTQLTPSGSVITWRRSLEPTEPVQQGINLYKINHKIKARSISIKIFFNQIKIE